MTTLRGPLAQPRGGCMSIDVSALQVPLAEFMSQVAGRNGEKRLEEFKLWLNRVIVNVWVNVDRSLTAEQGVNKTGSKLLHRNQTELASTPTELASAPITGMACVMLQIFELDYEPTPVELDDEYRSRGLTTDLLALSQYMCDRPEAVDKGPIICQWGLNPNGTAAYAIFDCFDSVREVYVLRRDSRWSRRYRFAGVREAGPVS